MKKTVMMFTAVALFTPLAFAQQTFYESAYHSPAALRTKREYKEQMANQKAIAAKMAEKQELKRIESFLDGINKAKETGSYVDKYGKHYVYPKQELYNLNWIGGDYERYNAIVNAYVKQMPYAFFCPQDKEALNIPCVETLALFNGEVIEADEKVATVEAWLKGKGIQKPAKPQSNLSKFLKKCLESFCKAAQDPSINK
ncbi:MAG: hypothetical protein LBG46_07090 [Elusimicrobiota bacterium]|jgi:hypothetical protein|nr:hypothetical protein [Elusimicrobiota bacterium]